ncbi:type II toxin-antitoxin system Phd/YefM family antitoxin [uncultured Thiohalocapsa sp.]|jgi:prevent-host-death family protein|uniref:type II toxin-antitoxin system Phd/YefM family antitoxin n=1 Tax=uncultured Thiohalocapsa sp. TaxID=768990 RepID=UPI0025E60863|nr:type II toxin-antitoxin system prevent-host-death family antitoxin [uncultured Thiohalocapsa sp.]
MQTVTTDYAAAHLEELIERVVQGESITLSMHGRPVARLVRIEQDADQEVPAAEVEEAFYGD